MSGKPLTDLRDVGAQPRWFEQRLGQGLTNRNRKDLKGIEECAVVEVG